MTTDFVVIYKAKGGNDSAEHINMNKPNQTYISWMSSCSIYNRCSSFRECKTTKFEWFNIYACTCIKSLLLLF